MTKKESLKVFDDRSIRSLWDDEQEEWYFSIIDVVAVLTDSVNPTTYWRKLKQRLKKEGNQSVTNCHALKIGDTYLFSSIEIDMVKRSGNP